MTNVTPHTLEHTLIQMNACQTARDWARGKSLSIAWATCARGDWLLWFAAAAGVDRRSVVLAACACARLALPYVRTGEERPLRAIETAERWARGDAGTALADVRAAAYAAADAAADAAAAYAAADAAADAADADAADAAAYAAYAATYAAAAAAYAATYAAAAAVRSYTLAICADLVREQIPLDVIAAALRGAP